MTALFVSKDEDVDLEVEANRLTVGNAEVLRLWCNGVSVVEHDALDHEKTYAGINVPTPSGKKRASEGDWIIRLSSGAFNVLKPMEFLRTFKPLAEAPTDPRT